MKVQHKIFCFKVPNNKRSNSNEYNSIYDLKKAIQQHHLWKTSIKLLWLSIAGKSSHLEYEKYKELRSLIDKSLGSSRTFEDSLSLVWKEWIGVKETYGKPTHSYFIESAMANNSIQLQEFSKIVFDAIKEHHNDLFLYLLKAFTLYFNITEGETLKESNPKTLAKVRVVPNAYKKIVYQRLRNNKRHDFKEWYTQSIMPIYKIKENIREHLAKIFPLDTRIHEVFDERYSNISPIPKKTKIFYRLPSFHHKVKNSEKSYSIDKDSSYQLPAIENKNSELSLVGIRSIKFISSQDKKITHSSQFLPTTTMECPIIDMNRHHSSEFFYKSRLKLKKYRILHKK